MRRDSYLPRLMDLGRSRSVTRLSRQPIPAITTEPRMPTPNALWDRTRRLPGYCLHGGNNRRVGWGSLVGVENVHRIHRFCQSSYTVRFSISLTASFGSFSSSGVMALAALRIRQDR
jgi:hypothetical protein